MPLEIIQTIAKTYKLLLAEISQVAPFDISPSSFGTSNNGVLSQVSSKHYLNSATSPITKGLLDTLVTQVFDLRTQIRQLPMCVTDVIKMCKDNKVADKVKEARRKKATWEKRRGTEHKHV